MSKEIDETDMHILRVLLKNARASYREVAGEVGVAVGTIQHRISKLEEKGVLKGFEPIISYRKMGYGVDAIIALETPRGKINELKQKLLDHKNVQSLYQTAGDVDIFVRVKFRDNQELYDFLMNDLSDQYVRSSKTYHVLDKKRNRNKLILGD